MTQAKTYPAIWYGVGRFRNTIAEKEFVRETPKRLYFKTQWGERYHEKAPMLPHQGDEWFPSKEQAEKRLAELKAEEDRRNERRAKEKAAPEMFLALENLLETVKGLELHEKTSSTARIEWSKALAEAVLAVRKAKSFDDAPKWTDTDEEEDDYE